MIRIEPKPWADMLEDARASYPNECCGVMLGSVDESAKVVRDAVPLRNAFQGARGARYELAPEDLIAAGRAARARGMKVIGVYHSHPDRDAYFSQADLDGSCPWYSFVVLSIRGGAFDRAASWLPDAGRDLAEPEELLVG